ncbi:hypothetical protein XYCOK13_28130 [Xylanibacillus composti]|uniref:Acylneuraminate cytidylyltransferase family protein n=1 Tax=Xylanibacillus composti TaxID=1572762 RepID=A0A8J4H344_9BACL|nr:acylneuraminate cytidylyltransferase family protein [Xylanibacillus composti]GIQ69989.1 hypothetical protein XYCOK13_28130 [Xylanibacillus composti]
MINNKRIVAVIPARGGSKSIPYKNIKELGGKPLIAWSIEMAKACEEIDRVIVSTEDEKIASVARQYGAEVIHRPEHLAQDDSLVMDAIKDLIAKIRVEGETAEYMVLLEPTSPMRSLDDIQQCLYLLADSDTDFDSVATFMDAELNPHRAWKIDDGMAQTFIDGAIPWLPRQKLPRAYQLNGAVYAFVIDRLKSEHISAFFGKSGVVLMPKERSVDIDDEIHFEFADYLLRRKNA